MLYVSNGRLIFVVLFFILLIFITMSIGLFKFFINAVQNNFLVVVHINKYIKDDVNHFKVKETVMFWIVFSVNVAMLFKCGYAKKNEMYVFCVNPIRFKVCRPAHWKIKSVIIQKLLCVRCRHTRSASLIIESAICKYI